MGEFDLTARLWPDASGSGNAATLSGDGFSRVRESGNGSPWFVTALQGGTSSVIRFGSGRIIESEFTICSVTRYTGGTKHRILTGDDVNWLHGHHGWVGVGLSPNPAAGVAYYNGWKTAETGHVSPDTDWVAMCGTNAGSQLKLVNGVDVGTSDSGSGGTSLWINGGQYASSQSSDFAIAELIVWPRGLASAEMYAAASHLSRNVLGAFPPPSPPPTPPDE